MNGGQTRSEGGLARLRGGLDRGLLAGFVDGFVDGAGRDRARVVVGTAAWPDPGPWLALGEAVVLAVDVRDGLVRSSGWTGHAGLTFEQALKRAVGARVLVTAIDRDGTLAGPDLDLVGRAAAAGLRVLAAGGVRSPADVGELAAAGAEAAVVGRALLAGDVAP